MTCEELETSNGPFPKALIATVVLGVARALCIGSYSITALTLCQPYRSTGLPCPLLIAQQSHPTPPKAQRLPVRWRLLHLRPWAWLYRAIEYAYPSVFLSDGCVMVCSTSNIRWHCYVYGPILELDEHPSTKLDTIRLGR